MVLALGQPLDLVLLLAFTIVVVGVAYLLFALGLSRRDQQPAVPAAASGSTSAHGYRIVFLIPCLNEERVLRSSLERLLDLPHPDLHVLVVDDGSEDGTAAIVRGFDDPRVHLLQRLLPEARQGKGRALNAGLAHLRSGSVVPVERPERVVVGVVDADGRLDSHALGAVLPLFEDPRLGGVQIGVRINNRRSNVLARLQDVEFVLYTEVFQRARRRLGSVGLGGNGQFVRLSALQGLGPAPWSASLTEDLDLGVRLLVQGRRLDFVSTAVVHQQGLTTVRAWLRQRARWFQGHLQAWGLVPAVLGPRLRPRSRADLLFHLTSPFLLLVASLLTAAFAAWLGTVAMSLLLGDPRVSWWWLGAYLFAVGPALLLGRVYRRAEPDLHLLRAVLLMHLYVGYATLWYLAGWRAVWRIARGQTGWAKTDRVREDTPTVASGAGR